MSRSAAVIAFSLAALSSCSKAEPTNASDTSGGHSGNGGAAALAPCLERPNELPRPPGAQLPCELIPPGFRR